MSIIPDPSFGAVGIVGPAVHVPVGTQIHVCDVYADDVIGGMGMNAGNGL